MHKLFVVQKYKIIENATMHNLMQTFAIFYAIGQLEISLKVQLRYYFVNYKHYIVIASKTDTACTLLASKHLSVIFCTHCCSTHDLWKPVRNQYQIWFFFHFKGKLDLIDYNRFCLVPESIHNFSNPSCVLQFKIIAFT